jgi:hypothetical protein
LRSTDYKLLTVAVALAAFGLWLFPDSTPLVGDHLLGELESDTVTRVGRVYNQRQFGMSINELVGVLCGMT